VPADVYAPLRFSALGPAGRGKVVIETWTFGSRDADVVFPPGLVVCY
jgi:hypothetical protein